MPRPPNDGAVFGEVKAVLEEGLGRNLITSQRRLCPRAAHASQPADRRGPRIAGGGAPRAPWPATTARALLRLADAYYGYGEYAEAAELYRAALQKGADANIVNTRLGAALAMAGQRAEAEAAFRAVTGPRAELANFWLLWLSSRT